MEFVLEWFMNGLGFGIGIIGCCAALVVVSGLVITVAGIVASIEDYINNKERK